MHVGESGVAVRATGMVCVLVPRALDAKTAQQPNGCWTWTADTIDGDGYLLVKVQGEQRSVYAHRLNKLFELGEIHEGAQVRRTFRKTSHTRCINPAQLRLHP